MRIGFYHRKKVISDFESYENVPIARYLCQGKGPQKPKHRTFSLLPHLLIPYRKNALNVVWETVSEQHREALTLEQTRQSIDTKGSGEYICLENRQLIDFQQIFTQALSKINTIPELKRSIKEADYFKSSDPIETMLGFIESYQSPLLTTVKLKASSAEKLAMDFFFHFQRGLFFDRHFLFGTPSQKRR